MYEVVLQDNSKYIDNLFGILGRYGFSFLGIRSNCVETVLNSSGLL